MGNDVTMDWSFLLGWQPTQYLSFQCSLWRRILYTKTFYNFIYSFKYYLFNYNFWIPIDRLIRITSKNSFLGISFEEIFRPKYLKNHLIHPFPLPLSSNKFQSRIFPINTPKEILCWQISDCGFCHYQPNDKTRDHLVANLTLQLSNF